MASPALDAAVDRIRKVFAGVTSPMETGCGMCHLPEETALLRTPDVELPDDVLRLFAHEVPNHFDDHPAVMRRILPQLAAQLATGRFPGLDAYELTGLARSRWQTWPAEQAVAVRTFLETWWADTVTSDAPPYPVHAVFESCVTAGSTVTPYLAVWAGQPLGGPADRHLADCLERWIDDLLGDLTSPLFSWWSDPCHDEPLAELQAWVAEHAPPRLRARGADPLLRFKTGLLALPYDQRWTEEVWAAAPDS
ncbi:hypothetical protein ACH4D4_25825 [Streptomyces pristinaespiralis]|uniref:hypothetical protein n=1 Tax=Streptomyces pristinaespiralis TaxID=38300 RepID=UPI00378F5CCF